MRRMSGEDMNVYNSKRRFFKDSIANKLYGILVLVSIVVAVIILTANFTSSTLSMVTSFARMERVHSVSLSDAKSSFYKYLVFEDDLLLKDYEKYIKKANEYSHNFGRIKSLIKDTPHKDAVKLFDDIFTEVDYRESDIIITRVGLLLWNPIVQDLIRIAAETDQITNEYRNRISQYTDSKDDDEKAKILSSVKEIEIQLERLPMQFSDATGALSDFASNVVKITLWVLFLVLTLVCVVVILPVVKSITAALRLVNESLRDMAEGEGDLTVQLPVKTSDEIGTLSKSFNLFLEKLRVAIKDVKENIDLQASATEEINGASGQLSSFANRQASSVEEISATLEQVSISVERNSENANTTSNLASGVASKAESGGKAVAETAHNMKEIEEKISIIEEIAFQINLLALNASVEAAHAGIHGKGFAVVANEVKKLAERTKIAAQDINELVRESVKSSDMAGKVVGEIVPDILQTAKLVTEISSYTAEQSISFSQINESMTALNEVSVESAAMADKLSVTSNSLSDKAKQLEETIGFFKVE